jgi:antitoxin Phd
MKRKVQVHRKTKASPTSAARRRVKPSRVRPAESKTELNDSAVYIAASEAKNRFATLIESVNKGQEVYIMKHNAPKAVVLSVERYRALSAGANSVLANLTAEFDARFARMQTTDAQAAMEKAFNASPDELGKAAVRAARSRS